MAAAALHVVGALLAVATAEGFSLAHPHALELVWGPAVIAVSGVFVLVTALRGRLAPLVHSSRALGAFWLAVSLSCVVLFPGSTWRLVALSAPLGVALLLIAPPSAPGWWLIGALPGLALVVAQRAPPPSTRPLGGEVGVSSPRRFVDVLCGELPLRVFPLLEFTSCAPDRFWAMWRESECPAAGASSVRARRDGEATVIEAETRLGVPVFSHLNAFAEILVDRAGLSVSLDEGPPVRLADGTGRLHFLWLDGAGQLHLSRGARDEKGPFTELAQQPLRDGRLSLALVAANGAACKLSFETWAAQASVAPAPTAGWGLPQNSVEFLESLPNDVTQLSLSLAATSVGAGWDSVGHSPGVYRNVIRVEPLRR